MAELGESPRGSRVHIAFFGLRNAGKSTLVNAFTGQNLAIVSDVAGTTTDPVSKAMEILPLGPCLITDTAGLDDTGALGEMRVRKTLDVLATTDIAVWVASDAADEAKCRTAFDAACCRHKVVALCHKRGENVEELKTRIAALTVDETPPPLLEGLVQAGDHIVCVCPIDESAPKGRLILPQQQVIRACLDGGAFCTVCQPSDLQTVLAGAAVSLVITDSQAFGAVRETLRTVAPSVPLTSFSILFARQKGDLAEYEKGLDALAALKEGDRVLIAEGCTHHRQCNDIGTVQLPKALTRLSGRNLSFSFASGGTFLPTDSEGNPFALVVQCGGCMLTRREVLRRIAICREVGVPIVNYGMVLAAANGLRLVPRTCFERI